MIRFFDIIFSGIAIIILIPFMIPIIIGLKLTGEHYVFYEQKRIGRYGREFELLKFATMLKESPNLPGGLFTSINDPRMLPMGKFLRKTKINELPQLINIFIGQMSIVGYRPTVREHFNAYPDCVKQKLYHSKPGLTGIGSIVFRNEEEILQQFEDKNKYHQNVIIPYKAMLESWYIDNRSLFVYFKIIVVTINVLLNHKTGIWKKYFCDIPPVPHELKSYI
ncbi:undecaprenyl- phosphate galactosephosphotransferase [Treponema primitia ZAS-2]|uniref:Undecaprenyl-phosphate galactosephosphotransferase n=1 Tax=Treponema primitia (strain ATCC BAA-887 / DSM 12427 / ZAS-2) TaxID=545694 RepID=F5YN29_TREPZ|nr:sugar transferase [Treponema primitia]AEF84775.1 undecaprenyl- phosphate galactosephosphotransferase [Treponema primitia ZAS-2]